MIRVDPRVPFGDVCVAVVSVRVVSLVFVLFGDGWCSKAALMYIQPARPGRAAVSSSSSDD